MKLASLLLNRKQALNILSIQAAHAVLQLQETGKPVYKVKNVSLNALCELYNAPVNPMKEQVKNIYRRDQKFWARRPLTRDMICYAGADVLALVPTIYTAMARSVRLLVESYYYDFTLQSNQAGVQQPVQ